MALIRFNDVVSCHETGKYVLSNPYVVVYSVSPGGHPAAITSVPLHKGQQELTLLIYMLC